MRRVKCKERGLRRVLVDVHFLDGGNNFTRVIVTAGAAHVVRALLLAAIRAISRVAGNKGIMRAAHVAAGFGGSILRDCHVTTFGYWGQAPDFLCKTQRRTIADHCCFTA